MSTIVWTSDLPIPAHLGFGIKANTSVLVSPFNGTVQTMELPGARWCMLLSFAPAVEGYAGPLRAFIASLRGQANRAALYNFAQPTPRGTALGTPLVNGASQALGGPLVTDGWAAGATLLKGDFFSAGSELKMSTADCAADGSGNMTIPFEPPFRSAPADNAAITTDRPTALFILRDPETKWDSSVDKTTNFELDFVEAFSQ